MWWTVLACGGTVPEPSPHSAAPVACPDGPGVGLTLATACVGALCGGTVFPDARAALGLPDACVPEGYGQVTCAWGPVAVGFPDCDHDGAPDETVVCDLYDQPITLSEGFAGTDDVHGLGLGVDAACFEAALGPPTGGRWDLGGNPWVDVQVTPSVGPVTTLRLGWHLDE